MIAGRPKTLEEAKQWMRERLIARLHPMNLIDVQLGLGLIEGLAGLDPDSWTDTWRGAGDRVLADAKQLAMAGEPARAAALYMQASGCYFMGRFPCPNHPKKLHCAELERESYLLAGALWNPPVERISVPFQGRKGEGSEVVFLLRRPRGVMHPPVVVMWGGVDAWKEQMTAASNAFLSRGIATIAMDNAGTGESPVRGVQDAERQFVTVFEWAAAQPDLNGAKAGCLGRSFGGYWATKLAHEYPELIAGAVNWGGGVHHMFQKDWIEASRHPDSYLMELVETRCRMLGAGNDDEYIEFFGRLSLLDQNLIDGPCAPLLLVNGTQDRQCPIEDIYLLLEKGVPKSVRLFPGGHMGITPLTLPTIVDWLAHQVQTAAATHA